MSTYTAYIQFQVEFECGIQMHGDLYNTIQQHFTSLPGVSTAIPMGIGYEITVTYGTYMHYMHEEYMRIIDDTRKIIEDLNQNYTDNKNMYDIL